MSTQEEAVKLAERAITVMDLRRSKGNGTNGIRAEIASVIQPALEAHNTERRNLLEVIEEREKELDVMQRKLDKAGVTEREVLIERLKEGCDEALRDLAMENRHAAEATLRALLNGTTPTPGNLKLTDPHPDTGTPRKYRVKIRRNLGLAVRLEAEQLDGKIFFFEPAFRIDENETYPGEWVMMPRDPAYPGRAPVWIASGDLEEVA